MNNDDGPMSLHHMQTQPQHVLRETNRSQALYENKK